MIWFWHFPHQHGTGAVGGEGIRHETDTGKKETKITKIKLGESNETHCVYTYILAKLSCMSRGWLGKKTLDRAKLQKLNLKPITAVRSFVRSVGRCETNCTAGSLRIEARMLSNHPAKSELSK